MYRMSRPSLGRLEDFRGNIPFIHGCDEFVGSNNDVLRYPMCVLSTTVWSLLPVVVGVTVTVTSFQVWTEFRPCFAARRDFVK